MELLIFIGIIWVIIDIIKEASEPTIPADYWNHAFLLGLGYDSPNWRD